jgi:hypothetical protein
MKWAGRVACVGLRDMYVGFWWENMNESDHLKDLDVGRRTILKRILEEWDRVAWTGFIWLRIVTSRGLFLP